MSGSLLGDTAPRGRAPTPPPRTATLGLVALLAAIAVILVSAWVLAEVRAALVAGRAHADWMDAALVLAGVGTLGLLVPALGGLRDSGRAAASLRAGDVVGARVHASESRTSAWSALGWSGAVLIVALLAFFVVTNGVAVGRTFFNLGLIWSSFGLVLRAFWVNVSIFVIAELLVLVWGLIVAVARLVPGRAGRPIRLLATLYTDIFRGLPAIITIYLVGFGLPLTGLTDGLQNTLQTRFGVQDLSILWAIIALTLTYGAYVAEVYRAGLESIHPSQVAAARSLGLGFGQTLRFVVVPQAVRRIVPPLLNNFIGLQKDTALVNVIGAVDAFNQAKIIATNNFNLSAVTTVAILFVLITIPQARFVDRLLARDQARLRSGGTP
ncbi:amino acid ABC transporter permease [Deinococcus planocerae]|uniref:amino acid ABC transporter permease n=1 Tax=Deinococcus planocerae TaxID=1737569 RepID=UPI001C643E74|nr:amino acid ABC transporter permease [Deinococcus planocerae]